MVSIQTNIKNESGLHARPATEFAMKAKGFSSAIKARNLSKGGEAVNAKSMLRLLSLGLNQGARVEITAEGTDENLAVKTLAEMIDNGFGE